MLWLLPAKLHLLSVVLVTLLTATNSKRLPYFPIEISRTVASGGRLAGMVFKLGVGNLIGTLFLSHAIVPETVGLWLALCVIAFFDDIRHPVLHVVGVAMLMIDMLCWALLLGDPWVYTLFALAFLVYASRMVLKLAVMMYYHDVLWPGQPLWTVVLQAKPVLSAMLIMQGGERAFDSSRAPLVLPVFRMGGVLQWVALATIACVF
jgi:hypothetical protein